MASLRSPSATSVASVASATSVATVAFRAGVVAALACALACGCSGKDSLNPGTPLGTFHVTARLTQSTCGSVPDPWEFDVRLSHEGSTLYWVQGGAPIAGEVDAQHGVVLKSADRHTVRPANAKTQLPACEVVRDDELAIALATADGSPLVELDDTHAFAGKLVYRFTPTAGSECTDQTAALGGDFEALPCAVDYAVSASLAKAPAR